MVSLKKEVSRNFSENKLYLVATGGKRIKYGRLDEMIKETKRYVEFHIYSINESNM